MAQNETLNVTIYNVETGETQVRPMTDEELAIAEADRQQIIAMAEVKAAKETARQALLDRLGITADEAALLGL